MASSCVVIMRLGCGLDVRRVRIPKDLFVFKAQIRMGDSHETGC